MEKKEMYEAPSALVVEVAMASGILNGSLQNIGYGGDLDDE